MSGVWPDFALGWRHRRHYDIRATFITLAIEGGADPDVIEARVIHTRKARNACSTATTASSIGDGRVASLKLRIARKTSVIERPLPAGSAHELLPFAAVVANVAARRAMMA